MYLVSENPKYTGRWWTDGGHRLWEGYTDPVYPSSFYASQDQLWDFLIQAQRVPEWEVEGITPVTWMEVVDVP